MAGILGILGIGLVAISGVVGPEMSPVWIALAALGFAGDFHIERLEPMPPGLDPADAVYLMTRRA